MQQLMFLFRSVFVALTGCLILAAQTVGKTGNGAILPTGWRITPAGTQIPVEDNPVQAELLPGGRQALVLHSGYRQPSVALLDLIHRKPVARQVLEDAGYHFSYVPALNRLFVPGGHASVIYEFSLEKGQLVRQRVLPLRWPEGQYPRSFASDTAVSADSRTLYVAEMYQDTIARFDLRSGNFLGRWATAPHPVRIGLAGPYLITLSASDSAIAFHDPRTGAELKRVPVSAGPADFVVSRGRVPILIVSGSHSNYVDLIPLKEAGALHVMHRLNLAMDPRAASNASPVGLALDSPGHTLYVACADLNAVVDVDLAKPVPRVRGYIPTGWYPTAVTLLPNRYLLVLNGKGGGSEPNPHGPNPSRHHTMLPQPPTDIQYVGLLQPGSASLLARPVGRALQEFTSSVYHNVPAVPGELPAEPNPVPTRAGAVSPIRNVIFVMKENRTYDQVLGDLERGNGDPNLTLFPERITPNHHKLAREFTLFDNFYVNADVSAEGWYWTSAGIAPHFVMKTWPAAYGQRTRSQVLKGASVRGEVIEDRASRPSTGFLWTQALRAGLSFRNFGFFVTNRPGAKLGEDVLAAVSDPALLPYTSRRYAGYDPDVPDIARVRAFGEEFADWEKKGEMPRLITMVLPNDHTWGTAPGKPTPFASMADNDSALGQLVELVSHSRFWAHTAILVLEDDAQNGPDHVDSHRSLAYVISPYTRRHYVDSHLYTTTSMLRTIEMILGLPALTHYDARAVPMLWCFDPQPDSRPYDAEPPGVALDERNPQSGPGAARSARIDWSQPDLADDNELNEILWRAARRLSEPPPKVGSYFVQ